MDCRDVNRLISAYWDRELASDRAAQVRAHLGSCPACHVRHGLVTEFLASPPVVSMSSSLRDRVLGAVIAAREEADAKAATLTLVRGHDEGDTRRSAASTEPTFAPVSTRTRRIDRLFPLLWGAAAAACITMILTVRPPTATPDTTVEVNPMAVPGLLLAAMQPGQLSAAGAAAAQAAALEQVTQSSTDASTVDRASRRSLRHDYVPSVDTAARQLPAVISAVSPLGA